MSIQMSSSARLDSTRNPERSVNENSGRVKWRKFLMSACLVAVAIDPLFLFIPELNSEEYCFSFDKTLGKIVCFLRTFIDTFYVIHVIVCFINEVIVPLDRSDKNPSRGESSVPAKAVITRRISLNLIVDIVSVLPIPQVVVLGLIVRSSTELVPKRILISFTKWVIVFQYIPRIIRIYPHYKEVTRTSGTIAESNWIGAALNLSLFMLFSYVFGAFWYVNGVEKKTRCWRDECEKKTPYCITEDLFCATYSNNSNNSKFLNNSCPLFDPDENTESFTNSSINASNIYDFGMYVEVLKSGVAEIKKKRDFPKKFVYCFWWGLRNLSTFATNLKPGNYATDILFAIIICVSGLFLFAVLIGNVQKYMLTTTARLEEMKERQRDTEKWMSSRGLPEDLKKRIRKYDDYKWRAFRGIEENTFLHSFPKDLRLETKRHLYKKQLKNVPLLSELNDWLLEAVCDRAKSVFYSAGSCIVREGEPVEELLIVTKGQLKCETKSGDHKETSELKEDEVHICGDPKQFWTFDPTDSPPLPTSNETVTTLNNVEGFILSPDDFKFVASRLDHAEILKVKQVFRSLSEQRRSECSSSKEPQKSADPEISKNEP